MRLGWAWLGALGWLATAAGQTTTAATPGLAWSVVEGDCPYVVRLHERASEKRRQPVAVETIVLARAPGRTSMRSPQSIPHGSLTT